MSESRIFSSSVESVRPRRRCASPTRLRKPAVARLLLALQVLFGVLRALRRGMHRAFLLPQAKLAQRVRRADHARTVKCRAASAVSRGSSALRYKNKTGGIRIAAGGELADLFFG